MTSWPAQSLPCLRAIAYNLKKGKTDLRPFLDLRGRRLPPLGNWRHVELGAFCFTSVISSDLAVLTVFGCLRLAGGYGVGFRLIIPGLLISSTKLRHGICPSSKIRSAGILRSAQDDDGGVFRPDFSGKFILGTLL